MSIHFYVVDVLHFQNQKVVYLLALCWRSFYPSTLGIRLVCLKAAPALIRRYYSK